MVVQKIQKIKYFVFGANCAISLRIVVVFFFYLVFVEIIKHTNEITFV